MSSVSSDSGSPSPLSLQSTPLERQQVLGRSVDWMRRAAACGGLGSWGRRHNLRAWNPWTNETRPAPQGNKTQHQRHQTDEVLATVGMTTKAAGGVYDFLVNQEQEQQQEQLRLRLLQDSSSDQGSSTVVPVRPRRSNSNTNNKNPFSLPDRASSGLRDIQRHRADGKQTTIITQFKAAESNQDGKVDINIIMDSESNVSNAQESSEEDGTTEDTTSKEGGGGGSGGISGSDDDEGGGAGRSPGSSGITSSTAPGEEGTAGTDAESADDGGGGVGAGGGSPAGGEGDGEEGDAEGDADDSEPAEELPAPGDEKKPGEDKNKKKLSMGHLDKEGVVIGCMNVFADVSRKEYIVLLTDHVVEAFLVDPGQFRSIAKRTGCEIEVTRRILNRRIGMYRWVKYLVVTLRGPHLVAIDQCDRLMIKMFPPYKIRKPYPEAAQVALFVKESSPDNSDLYFNYQRTGPTCAKVGDLKLLPPFGKSAARSIESTPWKQTNQRLLRGILEPRNLPMAIAVEHVYPEWGAEKCSFMEASCKWEQAGDIALDTEKRNNLDRSMRVKQRKLGAEPLFAGGD